MRIAYLNTQYPSLSHTFIEREIQAVRARGIEIDTFSIRPPRPQDVLGEHHAAAARDTFCLLASKARLARAQLAAALRHPLRYVRVHREAQRVSADGLRARALSIAYACEAVLLAGEMRRRGLTHIHVHMANNGAAVALLACAFDPTIRYSMSIHGSAEFFDVYRLNLKAKCERAVFVRCISNFCRAQVMAWSDPAAWGRYHIVHCGVDPGALTPAPPRAPGPIRLLTIGRLAPIKGYTLLLDALATLRDQGVEWSLELVGSGPMESPLRAHAASLRLTDRVVFTGPIAPENMPTVLDRNDALIVSSFMEGVPVVLMEAMAKELLVLSTAVAGVPELIDHGVTGVLAVTGSVDALVQGIRTLAQGMDSHSAMRTAARRKILAEFSVDSVGEGMCELFRRYRS